jgi:mono/diheme cytochrome c family protein
LKTPIQEKKVVSFSSKGGDAAAGRGSWLELCATCHGDTGKGGMSMGGPVADLTTPRWQNAVSDSQIADVILHGKGRMPSFTLDESALRDLVGHVRTLTEKPRGY